MKKLIAFDMDDTLAVSKSAISDEMGELFVQLLEQFQVCVISGGLYEQFRKQLIDRIEATPQLLGNLHLMPTCGTRYYRFDEILCEWQLQYAEDLAESDVKKIMNVCEESARALGLWPEHPYGEVVENRGSQISISMLGQQAPADEKHKWFLQHNQKRLSLRKKIAETIPDFEVRAGGSTTIDITRLGIDKAYGMRRLSEVLDISKDEILFVGDKLDEGGNDYPVKAMGIDTIAVTRWEDTALVIRGILGVNK